ncbi:MAG: universal stress protein [Rubripirellula sp.]
MRIVLAVDHSSHSDEAVEFLLTQNFTLPLDIDLVSVIVPFPAVDMVGTGGMIPDVGAILSDEQNFIQERLGTIEAKLKSRCREIHCHVKIGSPAFEIAGLARDVNADLVVLGAIGHSAIERVLLGSVSDYVATHANCTALVIRPHAEGKRTSVPKRILVAVGSDETDLRLLDQLTKFDLPKATQIDLVHVMQTLTFFHQDIVQRTSELWLQARETATQHLNVLENAIKKHGFRCEAAILEESHIGEALTAYATEHDCGLVLAGDQQRGLLDRAMLGSTSRYLLRHLTSSVLIVRARDD